MDIGHKFKIESDSLNITLSKRRVSEKTHKEYWQSIGYFSRFGNALKSLIDLEVRETHLEDLRVVCEKQDELYKLIDSLGISSKGVKNG